MGIILNIENQPIYENDDGSIEYDGYGRIDDDGLGSSWNDPDHQAQTSLKNNGKYLDADVDLYVVAPPQIINGVAPIVLGCLCYVTYNNKTVIAVVGDVGPHSRLGEISRALAIALGIDPDPNNGGVDSPDVHYKMYPGTPSPGYQLQPW